MANGNGNSVIEHHVVPFSRIRKNVIGKPNNGDNFVFWQQGFHLAYHIVFGDLVPEEAHLFLKIINKIDGRDWSWKSLDKQRLLIKKRFRKRFIVSERNKETKNGNGKSRITKHHVIPTSRLKDKTLNNENNIVFWQDDFHIAYHIVFGNLTPEEAHLFLAIVNKTDQRKWHSRALEEQRTQIKLGKI